MGLQAATIELLGSDDRILEADEFLNAKFLGEPKTLMTSAEILHHAILCIAEDCTDDTAGISAVMSWLEEREQDLLLLNAAITIELECALLPSDASRFLTVSALNLTVLADLGCALRIQYMKCVT